MGLETGTDANKDLLVCFFWAEGGGGLFLSFCRHENLSIPLAGLRTLGSREKLLRVHRRCRRWPSTRWIHDREDDTSQKASLLIYCFEIFPPLSLILAISPLLLVGHMELRFWRLSSLQVAHELHLKLSRTPIFNIDKYAGWGEGALTEAEQSRQFLSEEAVGNLSAKGVISSVRARAANAIEANSYTIAMAAAKQLQSEMPVHITLLSLSLSLSLSFSVSVSVSLSFCLSFSLSLFISLFISVSVSVSVSVSLSVFLSFSVCLFSVPAFLFSYLSLSLISVVPPFLSFPFFSFPFLPQPKPSPLPSLCRE